MTESLILTAVQALSRQLVELSHRMNREHSTKIFDIGALIGAAHLSSDEQSMNAKFHIAAVWKCLDLDIRVGQPEEEA